MAATRIMVDLETLGSSPGAVIMSLGAVKFGGGLITDTFYERIDPQTCVDAGLNFDLRSIMFWMKQSEEARQEILKPGQPLRQVLEWFAAWVGTADPEPEVWGNGSTFDNMILASAYDALKIKKPWVHWGDRCFRTVRQLNAHIPMERHGTHHNALEDARTQALHLMKIFGEIPAS